MSFCKPRDFAAYGDKSKEEEKRNGGSNGKLAKGQWQAMRVSWSGKFFPMRKHPQPVRVLEIAFAATPSNQEAFAQPGDGGDLKGNVRFIDVGFLRRDGLCGISHDGTESRPVSVHVQVLRR